MSEFQHSGFTIQLTNSGKFTATIDGKCIMKPSLPAMKKFIDDRAKNAFKPFDVIRDEGYREFQLVEYSVIGLYKKTGRRYGPDVQFILQAKDPKLKYRTGNYAERVILDTPENRAILKEISDYEAETHRIEEQRKEELETIEERLTHVNASDFKKESA